MISGLIIVSVRSEYANQMKEELIMASRFEEYSQDENLFLTNLAEALGHPGEIARSGMVLRNVLHTLRDHITVSESLKMISQLPVFLKALYVDNWTFTEKPMRIKNRKEFTTEVEKHEATYGERVLDWKESTEEMVMIVIRELESHISKGEDDGFLAQMPEDLKKLFREITHA